MKEEQVRTELAVSIIMDILTDNAADDYRTSYDPLTEGGLESCGVAAFKEKIRRMNC